ncbi:hypothetical protein PENANT_c011G05972 [Penicillium antarcticum]|uniref:polynucleotide adenylyltransferase n=1 Tax=Penicillium antarcticum TaxID=416450 RepID=A0A1V6Q762_9EURO|nr:uncharacterized protein N7508_003096 [Penicillium antarcticum]KAJ5312266.1 hypothetical protein N7508_003096 [Penicillium antarcticum]OQD85074.1 hypothetical protein PENANT_c011G05972 [Penicillium antarcticum]
MPPFQFRGNSNYRGSRPYPRHEFTFRAPKPPTAERPLLSNKRESTPEQLQGETKSEPKFASLATLSDSEEVDMDTSDSEDDERPRKRRALGLDGLNDADVTRPDPPPNVPKWSNPDPYTALPPPDESKTPKIDFVKLIRKARLDNAAKSEKSDAVTDNQDFISLGMADEAEPQDNAPEGAPRGPKAMEGLDPSITSRKRTRDDELKGFSRKSGKPASRFNFDGSVVDQWRPLPNEAGTPWLDMPDHPQSMHIGTQLVLSLWFVRFHIIYISPRLHNEIMSFYHWAKPQDFENIVRADLITRVETAFRQRYSNIQVRAFGSYASGLYLPTADIDLVLLSNTFTRTGVRTFGERKGQIYGFSAFVKGSNLAVPNSIECIAGARVPILKWVDKLTGLRVDLSFDNDSGLVANETFKKWKAQFPSMPVILSVIKQFLLIRGLNEVPTGGLGGFSITCLVTSLLQHYPQGHSQPNLGSILMDFFYFYGKHYRYETQGIRMEPPGYFNKTFFGNPDRLTIEDPNNQDNDISGGTKEISLILRTFSKAHTTLQRRVEQLASNEDHKSSILGPIIAANFDEYIEQREQLRHVFLMEPRFARYRTPPPPPPGPYPEDGVCSPPLPPGPPPGPRQSNRKEKNKSAGTKSEPEDISSDDEPSGETKSGKPRRDETRRVACKERAARLKRLRPDLSKISNSLSFSQARRVGGYETNEEMERDLDNRERDLHSKKETNAAWKMVMDDA